MNPAELSMVVHLGAGALVLFFGRRLFWLFVGVAGFLVSFRLVPQLLPGQSEIVVLVLSLSVGIAGSILAVVLQYAAVAVAGFGVGVYVLVYLQGGAGVSGHWLLPIVGGALGGLVAFVLLDWGLILLSAAVGSSAIMTTLVAVPLTQGEWIAWAFLFVLGALFQGSLLSIGRSRSAQRPD